jgi:hypothetical protein
VEISDGPCGGWKLLEDHEKLEIFRWVRIFWYERWRNYNAKVNTIWICLQLTSQYGTIYRHDMSLMQPCENSTPIVAPKWIQMGREWRDSPIKDFLDDAGETRLEGMDGFG